MDTETRPSSEAEAGEPEVPLKPENRQMLEFLREWRNTPLTEEEIRVLDEMKEFQAQRRRQFYGPDPEG